MDPMLEKLICPGELSWVVCLASRRLAIIPNGRTIIAFDHFPMGRILKTNTRFEICIDATHPALSGHFPGDPIVPGALLLAEITARLAAAGMAVTGLRKVRFTQPVRPADRVGVACRSPVSGQLRFECTVAETVVARGTFIVTEDDKHG